jgi:hypothetical protein
MLSSCIALRNTKIKHGTIKLHSKVTLNGNVEGILRTKYKLIEYKNYN